MKGVPQADLVQIAPFVVWDFWKHQKLLHDIYRAQSVSSSIRSHHSSSNPGFFLINRLHGCDHILNLFPSWLTDSCSVKIAVIPIHPSSSWSPSTTTTCVQAPLGVGPTLFPTLFRASLHFEYEDGSMGPDYQRLKRDSGSSLPQTHTLSGLVRLYISLLLYK